MKAYVERSLTIEASSDLDYQTLRVDTYIIDSLRAGRRFELEENDVSDTHFRALCFMGSVGT